MQPSVTVVMASSWFDNKVDSIISPTRSIRACLITARQDGGDCGGGDKSRLEQEIKTDRVDLAASTASSSCGTADGVEDATKTARRYAKSCKTVSAEHFVDQVEAYAPINFVIPDKTKI